MSAYIQQLPPQSALSASANTAYIVDSFAIESNKLDTPIEEIYARLMSITPKWFDRLMKIRDGIVRILGLKSTQTMAGQTSLFVQTGQKFNLNNTTIPNKVMDFFTVIQLTENEIILSIKDKHLDMQISLLRSRIDAQTGICQLSLNDVIFPHNHFGRFYLLFVMPVHKIIIKNTLNQAKKRGDI